MKRICFDVVDDSIQYLSSVAANFCRAFSPLEEVRTLASIFNDFL